MNQKRERIYESGKPEVEIFVIVLFHLGNASGISQEAMKVVSCGC